MTMTVKDLYLACGNFDSNTQFRVMHMNYLHHFMAAVYTGDFHNMPLHLREKQISVFELDKDFGGVLVVLN